MFSRLIFIFWSMFCFSVDKFKNKETEDSNYFNNFFSNYLDSTQILNFEIDFWFMNFT